MSNQQNKLQKERNQKVLLELASQPGNNICADCKARNPRWASHNLGIFICVTCASIHRKIGTHITKVKSLTVDEWTKDQIEHMKSMGNIKSNSIYNPNELRNPPPPNLDETERDSEIEQYIRGKYEYRKFIDKNALVASKLGPSRSAASVTPRSASLNMASQSQPSTNSRAPAPVTDAAASSSAPPRMPPSHSTSTISHLPTSVSQHQTRSASQPVPAISTQTQQNKTQPSGLGGVWDDINSLASPGQNSSLPLQYQSAQTFAQVAPMSAPVHGTMGPNSYNVSVAPTGMVANPFQPNAIGQNPFSQQQQQPPFPTSPLMTSVGTSFVSTLAGQPSYSPQYFSTTSTPSTPMISQSTSAPFLQVQPQAQSALQTQVPTGQNFLSPSPSQSLMSMSTISPQYASSSPSQQFLSHSPQPQFQLPQSAAPQNQYLYQNSASAQPQMNLGMAPTGATTQSQFLGMTTMQMQQQQLLMQQQQQQQMLLQQQFSQGSFAPNQQQPMYAGQIFPQSSSFSPQGGQWGAM